MQKYIDFTAGSLGAVFGYFFGGFDGLIHALLAFVVIDYITGIFAASIEHKLSSAAGFVGIKRKLTIFILVGVAHILDDELHLFGSPELLRDGVISFYLANEGLSILENAIRIGIPVPEVIKDKLEMFHEKKDKKDKKK